MSNKEQYDFVVGKYVGEQKIHYEQYGDLPRILIKKILPSLEKKKVLDAGCGSGQDILLYQSLKAEDIWGIDISNEMVLETKKIVAYPKNILNESIQKTSFPDDFFDIIISRHALHYVENMDEVYKEWQRIIKTNGILIVVADHPLRALTRKKNKIYGSREVEEIILGDNIRIKLPAHTLKEYFSEKFFEHFKIDYYNEGYDSFEKERDEFLSPNFLIFKATKR